MSAKETRLRKMAGTANEKEISDHRATETMSSPDVRT